MSYERVERVKYGADAEKPGVKPDLSAVLGAEVEWDFKHFHDARAMLHQRSEHDWGVAAGLEVSQTDEGDIKVEPGVAIDRSGQIIVLSEEDVKNQASGTIYNKDLPTTNKPYYVTIRFDWSDPTVWRTDSKRRKISLTPKVSPEDTGTFEEKADSVVLAVVELNSDRTIKQLAPALDGVKFARKLVGVPAGEIRLRRSELTTKDGQPPTVSDTVAVTLRPTEKGDGVEIDGRAKVKAIDVQDKVSTKDLEVTQNAKFTGNINQNVGNTTVLIDSAGLRLDRSDKNKEGGRLSFGQNRGQLITLYPTPGSAGYGIGIQDRTQYFRTDKNFAWYKGGNHNDGELNHGGGVVQMVIKDGNVGIGEADPKQKLTVTGEAKVAGLNVSGKATAKDLDVTGEAKVAGLNVTGEAKVAGLNVGGTATAKDLDVTGGAKVAGLNVTGGAKVAGLSAVYA